MRAAADQSDLRALRLVGLGLLAISMPVWALEKIRDIQTVISGGYLELYREGGGSGITILTSFFVAGSLFLMLGSEDRSVGRILGAGIIIVNALVEFFLGSRTHAMWPLLAMVWAYHRAIRPFPRLLLVGGGLATLGAVFPLVKVARGLTGEDRTSLEVITSSYSSLENPLIQIMSEMGYSMMTVAHTLQLVPGSKSYEYGLGYLFALTTVVPSLFGELHPAIARGTAARWLVETVAPWTASQGGGLGFSFIAEGYYNFGWWGGLFALLAIGRLMSWFFIRNAYHNSILGIAVAAVALSFLTYFARGETTSIVRLFVWYTLLPYVAVTILANGFRRVLRVSPIGAQSSAG